jgi:PLP dependent protein
MGSGVPMDLASNWQLVEERIQAACDRSQRERSAVSLVAVSKGHPPQVVRAAADLGHRLFGESKVQEGKAKVSLCPGHLRWHMVGHLQANKCRDAVHFFEMIESVDTFALAHEIDKWAEKAAKRMPILLEVNLAGESTKFGFKPEQVLNELEHVDSLPCVEVHGLMTVAPWTDDPEKVRPIFSQLRDLKDQCEAKLGVSLPHLSMGMSGDFEVAIEEGATIVRIGTALFGPRAAARKAFKPT